MSRACACLRRAVCTTACAGCRLHRAQPLPSAPFNVKHPATCSVDCRATMPPPSPAFLLSLWRRCALRRCAERCSGCKREAACSPRARAHTCQPEAAAAALLPHAARVISALTARFQCSGRGRRQGGARGRVCRAAAVRRVAAPSQGGGGVALKRLVAGANGFAATNNGGAKKAAPLPRCERDVNVARAAVAHALAPRCWQRACCS